MVTKAQKKSILRHATKTVLSKEMLDASREIEEICSSIRHLASVSIEGLVKSELVSAVSKLRRLVSTNVFVRKSPRASAELTRMAKEIQLAITSKDGKMITNAVWRGKDLAKNISSIARSNYGRDRYQMFHRISSSPE